MGSSAASQPPTSQPPTSRIPQTNAMAFQQQDPCLPARRMRDSLICERLPLCSDPETRALYSDHTGEVLFGRLLEDLDSAAGAAAYMHCGYPSVVDGWSLASVRRTRLLMNKDQRDPGINNRPGTQESKQTTDAAAVALPPPPVIVTASLDRLDLVHRPSLDADAMLLGHVTCVGSSSMEVTLRLFEHNNNTKDNIPTTTTNAASASAADSIKQLNPIGKEFLVARFTMVARNPESKGPVRVNALVTESQEERQLVAKGIDAKARRRAAAETNLSRAAPTAEERLLIHDLWLRSGGFGGGIELTTAGITHNTNANDNDNVSGDIKGGTKVTWMADSVVEAVHPMRPQDRNMHNFVFGGHLMRIAADSAEAAALLYARGPARFLAMDDVNFRKPVPIGSLVCLRACVIYARSRSMLVRATADVIDVSTGARDTTNVFHFVFAAVSAETNLAPLLPRTYAESMLYLDGKRRYEVALAAANEAQSALLKEWT